jgi:hypothetical protein
MTDTPVVAPMIFISYRRDDSSGHVGRLYDALSAHFGKRRLFFDIDHIAPGQDFVRVLEDSLSRSSVMIVVMGKRWAGSGKVGARRIDDPGDFVRLEVASGLRRPELRLIPALIQGAKMPAVAGLPDDLKDMSRRNAIELSDLRWREDVERLIASLEHDMAVRAPQRTAAELVRKVREVTIPPSIAKGARWKWLVGAAAALVVLIGARAVLGHKSAAATQPDVSSAMTTSAAAAVMSSADDPKAVPSHLQEAAHNALAAGRKWRQEAVLTQIVALAPDSSASDGAYRVQFGFRSPADGAGYAFTVGAPGAAKTERLDAVPMSTIRALPDSFIDLPAAIDAARKAGMYGSLREGRLASISSRGVQRPAWRLRSASDGARLYYIDATSGAEIPPPPHPKGLADKVKRLFH